ncbi:MAG: ssk1 response regulator receiver [Bogoriella megaspora]|nr:MAG: ssk1 response regulator receiver [Bogoriella megaspora]
MKLWLKRHFSYGGHGKAKVSLAGADPTTDSPQLPRLPSPRDQRPQLLHSKSDSSSGLQPSPSVPISSTSPEPPSLTSASSATSHDLHSSPEPNKQPTVTIEQPSSEEERDVIEIREDSSRGHSLEVDRPPSSQSIKLAYEERRLSARPSLPVRRQSLVHNSNQQIITTLLESRKGLFDSASLLASAQDYITPGPATNMASIMYRKLWVKRVGASPTQVQIREDDLVDDVRDVILKKYGNSLGRNFDSPDVELRILSRSHSQSKRQRERTLAPDEDMCRTLDAFYPGGQTVDEALIIHITRHTPLPSPRIHYTGAYHHDEHHRPVETGTEYFPPMPAVIPASSHSSVSHDSRASTHPHESLRAMSVVNTGQVPPLPSPGGTLRVHNRHARPRLPRNQTATSNPGSTPNANAANSAAAAASSRPSRLPDSLISERSAPAPPPLPTPPAPEAPPTNPKGGSTPPTPNGHPINRVTSPDPASKRNKRRGGFGASRRNGSKSHIRTDSDGNVADLGATLSPPAIDSSVPPINCLIVEDNIINLKLLEAFMKRLKVRWQTAMNGQAAVTKWRNGGFHLVLMDIQLPIMSGLEATKEIRRLERVNDVGVLGNSARPKPTPQNSSDATRIPTMNGVKEEQDEEAADKCVKPDESDQLDKSSGLFKSPVIIVALTASSLQSDRHEALAAGCNDFLTKPVNFVWLERKVKEWGCMQALIDFDGWRKWKDFASENGDPKTNGAKGSVLGAPKNHTRKGSASGKNLRERKRRSDSSSLAAQLPSAMERLQVAETSESPNGAATPEKAKQETSEK